MTAVPSPRSTASTTLRVGFRQPHARHLGTGEGDRILRVTIVSEHAGDLLAEYVLAMKHGLGLNKIAGTIHTYSTLAEANKYVAGEWKRTHTPKKLLEWVGRYHRWERA